MYELLFYKENQSLCPGFIAEYTLLFKSAYFYSHSLFIKELTGGFDIVLY